MDDNSLSIDLKKLRRNLPPPEVSVAPIAVTPAQPPKVHIPEPTPTPPMPRAMPTASALPPKPRRGILGKIPLPSASSLLSWRSVVIAVVLLVVIFGGHYIYANFWSKSPFGPTQGTSSQVQSAAPSASAADLTEAQILEQVGKIILLPPGETPTLAKVSDPSVLQSQVFFKNATVGDIVLMYPKSLRAILYDPTQNKIIEVGPITAASASTTSAATSTSK